MGASFTNLHIRNASPPAICSTLLKLTPSRAYVSPPSNGWVTVYPEATEDQNEKTLCAFASGLSRTLKTDVLGVLVHHSDIAAYWLYRNGVLIDEFNSAPDHFGEYVDEQTRARLRGDTDVLLPLCVDGTTSAQLDEVLHPADGPPTFAEEIVTDLAKLLGIDDARASLGFNYFNEEGEQLLPDAGDFEPVGNGTNRKVSQESGPTDLDDILPANPIPLPLDTAETPDGDESLTTASPLPDMYPLAIAMLTQTWSDQHKETVRVYSDMFKQNTDVVFKKMLDGFDETVRELLKKSAVSNRPTFEELKTARDQGPEALAELIAKKTPGQLTEIGIGAAVYGLDAFLAALLKHGLDPNASNAQGRTTLSAAESHGKDSAVYRLVKAMAEGKR
jgi:hypothetical protein